MGRIKMTPEELSSFFIRHGYHQKMKSFISSSGEIKYKLGKNSLQKFRGTSGEWFKIWSAYYKDISINDSEDKLHIEKKI